MADGYWLRLCFDSVGISWRFAPVIGCQDRIHAGRRATPDAKFLRLVGARGAGGAEKGASWGGARGGGEGKTSVERAYAADELPILVQLPHEVRVRDQAGTSKMP